MADLGFDIDMIIMSPDGEISPDAASQVHNHVHRLYVLKQLSTRRCAATIAPTRVSRNACLSELRLERTYELTLMEAEDTLPILNNPSLETGMKVLRIHNNESRYMAELARSEEHFLRRQFFWIESLRLRLYSRAHFHYADALWFISMKEREDFLARNQHFAGETAWLPPGLMHQPTPMRTARNSKAVLFVGSLDIPLNREALSWYIAQVHPRLTHDPAYQLVVAGSTQGRASACSFAAQLRNVPHCKAHVDREDLSSLYADCAVFINPMRRGGGVKLKTIHAVANGIPVVSSEAGIEGSGLVGGVHLKVANTALEFAAAVSYLLSNPDAASGLAFAASQLLLRCYDTKANIRTLTSSLQSHLPDRA